MSRHRTSTERLVTLISEHTDVHSTHLWSSFYDRYDIIDSSQESVPLQLVAPELTGVVVRWRVGDVLRQRAAEGQLGQDVLRPVNDRSVDHLQEDR